jgi:hypothetical protein
MLGPSLSPKQRSKHVADHYMECLASADIDEAFQIMCSDLVYATV